MARSEEVSLGSIQVTIEPTEWDRDLTEPDVRPIIDRYRLLHELGRGAMARVHAAVTHGPGGFEHLAAIKTLLDCHVHDVDFSQMLLDEARIGAAIRHPNVVETLDVGMDPETGPYLVMQYVEGVTLATLTKRAKDAERPLPTRVVVRVIADMLEGLAAAHAVRGADGVPLGIVHRDVSPQNLLIGVDGVAKLSDFGIAKAKSRLTTTRAGQFKGKASYSAPEHVAGQVIDARADVFSAGVMLWESLLGQRLFKGDMVGSMRRVLNEPIPWLSRIEPKLDAYDELCARALERDRAQRFQSAGAFLEELIRIAEKNGHMGTHREVAACVTELCGDTIESERHILAHQRTLMRGAVPGLRRKERDEITPAAASDITVPSPPPESMVRDAAEVSARRASARLDTLKVPLGHTRTERAARWGGYVAVGLSALALVLVLVRVAPRIGAGSSAVVVVEEEARPPEPTARAASADPTAEPTAEPAIEAPAQASTAALPAEPETVVVALTTVVEPQPPPAEPLVERAASALRRPRPTWLTRVRPPPEASAITVEVLSDAPDSVRTQHAEPPPVTEPRASADPVESAVAAAVAASEPEPVSVVP